MIMKHTEKFFDFAYRAIIISLIIYVLSGALSIGGFVRDNTDNPESWLPSGMRLHKDNLTGCEYLGGKNGGLTPRLNKDGEQVGCR